MLPENAITIYNIRSELPSDLRNLTAASLLAAIEEAQAGYTANLFAIYRDLIASDNQLQSEFAKRKWAVTGDTVSIQPWDKNSHLDVATKDICAPLLDSAVFNDACAWLLNGTLYPVAVVEKVYRQTPDGFKIKSLIPVPYRLLDYRDGILKIFDTDKDGTVLPTTHIADPARYIVHRGHTLPIPDTWGGPMRSILFWVLLRTMGRQWWADLLERFGMPFLKGKYRDQAGKDVLEKAFRMALRLGGIVVSQNTEVEITQAAASDSSSSHNLFIELCNKEISKLIVGQTLSSTADSTGIGQGAAPLQGEVRDDIRKADARHLSMTLRNQLFMQLCAINGLAGNAPNVLFGADSAADMFKLVASVKHLYDAGLEPDDEGLETIQERVGFGIRRRAAITPAFPFSATPLSAVPETPSSSHVDRLAASYTAHDEAIQDIILRSTSSGEALRRIKEYVRAHPSADASEIVAEVMEAFAARALRGRQ
ncbi:MAG: DUF935 family protein [Lentisphaerae bacterium]|nr:DUF935 family protein [Lentisphaerota bacterium]